MTYKDNFVVEVKCNGKILRPRDGAVYLPFGSEYSIFLKNLNSRRASVKISVDGQDALDYHSLILDGNTSTELEGFLSGTVARNKFKFIQKTQQIQEHRGDKADDGMIRVEFAFEKPKPIRQVIQEDHEHHHHHHHHRYSYYHWWPDWSYTSSLDSGSSGGDKIGSSGGYSSSNSGENSGDVMRGISKGGPTTQAFFSNVSNVTCDSLGVESLGKPLDDEGITVKGSECHQAFRYGSIGELEESKVIVIRLKGFGETGTTVEKPITVKDKFTCSSCGTKSKSSYKFCPNCGTFLE